MPATKSLPSYTVEDVQKHAKENDVWVIFKDKVLDLSSWMHKHPGGAIAIMAVAGTDATDEILGLHQDHIVDKLVPAYIIGTVSNHEVPPHVVEYRELMDKVTHDPEWMTTDLSYYTSMLPRIVALFAASVSLYLGTQSLPLHMLAGVCMGMFWQQTLLIGHDCGHASILRDTDKEYRIGFVVGPLLNGFAMKWWRKNHNTHHVATNSVEHDPDIQHLPFLAISERFFDNLYSTYYERTMLFDAFAMALVSIQHWLYYPVMGLARFFIHFQGMALLLDPRERIERRFIEILGMVLYLSWFFVGLVWFLGGLTGKSTTSMVAYVLSSHLAAGILHIQITLNHFASPEHTDAHNVGAKGGMDFLKSQLTGTCDISCPEYMDWFHGGLQFQVEHHLCPRLPRHKLRELMPHIKDIATRHNLPYISRTFYEANCCVFGKFRDVAMLARARHTKAKKA